MIDMIAAMKTDFTVGKITAKPGEMVSGFLDEGIPVTVVNGRQRQHVHAGQHTALDLLDADAE